MWPGGGVLCAHRGDWALGAQGAATGVSTLLDVFWLIPLQKSRSRVSSLRLTGGC